MAARRVVGIGFVGLVGVLLASEALGLRINLSPSMPLGLYRLSPCGDGARSMLRLGDLVAIDTAVAARSNEKLRYFRERGYLTFTGSPRDFLLKEVAGLGGELVEETEGRLRVETHELSAVASFRTPTARGEALPEVSFPLRLGPDELWLSSEHRFGIDSRYFGGVPLAAVACRVEALWTR